MASLGILADAGKRRDLEALKEEDAGEHAVYREARSLSRTFRDGLLEFFFDTESGMNGLEAALCFDIGHARQVDPTMTEAYLILRDFGSRLRQIPVSEVNTRSKHDTLSYTSILAFQEFAHLIPVEIPLILETPVREFDMEAEIERVRSALPVGPRTAVA